MYTAPVSYTHLDLYKRQNLTFTAEMEEKLDKVADGETDWVKLLESFYGGFKKELEHAQEAAAEVTLSLIHI